MIFLLLYKIHVSCVLAFVWFLQLCQTPMYSSVLLCLGHSAQPTPASSLSGPRAMSLLATAVGMVAPSPISQWEATWPAPPDTTGVPRKRAASAIPTDKPSAA